MNGTLAIVDHDVELLRQHGLTDDQAEQVVVICGQHGVSVASVIHLLEPAIVQATRAVEELADLAGLCRSFDAPTPSHDEQRRRSMRKPTGKPWEKRRRR